MSYLFIRSSSDYVFCVCFNLLKIGKRTNYSVQMHFCNSFVCSDLANP